MTNVPWWLRVSRQSGRRGRRPGQLQKRQVDDDSANCGVDVSPANRSPSDAPLAFIEDERPGSEPIMYTDVTKCLSEDGLHPLKDTVRANTTTPLTPPYVLFEYRGFVAAQEWWL